MSLNHEKIFWGNPYQVILDIKVEQVYGNEVVLEGAIPVDFSQVGIGFCICKIKK